MTLRLPLPDPPTAGPLTDAQRDAVVRWVYAHGYQRRRRQSRFDEADILTGAMCAFFARGMQHKIPAGWVLGPLANQDVLTERQARWATGLSEAPEEALAEAPEKAAPPPQQPAPPRRAVSRAYEFSLGSWDVHLVAADYPGGVYPEGEALLAELARKLDDSGALEALTTDGFGELGEEDAELTDEQCADDGAPPETPPQSAP